MEMQEILNSQENQTSQQRIELGGNRKMENQNGNGQHQGGSVQQNQNNKYQQGASAQQNQERRDITYNRMGISATGVIFTVTSQQICDYIEKYFADKGMAGIKAVANIRNSNRLEFYAVVSTKDSNVRRDDTINRIFGDSSFKRVSMNGKLREVLSAFISDEVPYLTVSEKSRDYCYATLDYAKILAVCLDVNIYTQLIDIIDIQTITKKVAVLRIAKIPKETPKGPDLEDLITR